MPDKENERPADESSFAGRNPSKPIIPPRTNYRCQTDIEKAGTAQKREVNKKKREALNEDVRVLQEAHEQSIKELAEKHNRPADKIRLLVTAGSHYKPKRAVNLQNAIVHYKALELNEDREEGERLKLAELQASIKDDDDMEDLSNEQKKELISLLQAHRDQKSRGARANNQAAAVDAACTVANIHNELVNLGERTGAMGFMVVTKGHIDDSVATVSIDSQGASDFLIDVFNITPNHFVRAFELWACTKDNRTKTTGLDAMKTECTTDVVGGLRIITKRPNIGMSYVRYEQDVKTRFKVILRGWPEGVPFTSPSNLNTVDDVRSLRDALKSGQCAWFHMTAAEQSATAEALNSEPRRVRKQRSDKGMARGPRNNRAQKRGKANVVGEDDAEEDARPRKKAKRGKKITQALPPRRAFKSRLTIDSDDDQSGEDDE